MLKLLSSLAIAGAFASLTFLSAAPALALSGVTFVSGKGTNSGTCASPATPCRHFQFALGQTRPGGEIKALDPAPYGPMVITQSISISGIEGAGINIASGDAITISVGPNDRVNLSHLDLDGFKTANNGIRLNSGGSLTITHCTVRNFNGNGILIVPTAGTTNFLIADTVASDNSNFSGIAVISSEGSAQGTLDHVLMSKNAAEGIFVSGVGTSGFTRVMAVGVTANNNGIGFGCVGRAAFLGLVHLAAAGNLFGVAVSGGSIAVSAGNNFIRGNNNADIVGILTNVGTQ